MFDSEQAAAEALAAANTGQEAAATAPAPVQPEQAAAPSEVSPQVESGATANADSFVDIDQLPDELKPMGKQLLGDYTRKTQEIAAYRNALRDAGLSPEEAQQALSFVTALRDPNNLQALYERLDSQFGATAQDPGEFGNWGEEGSTDPRDNAINELQSRLDEFERQQQRVQVEAFLDREEAAIRTENPSWEDSDLEYVARLAVSNGGNLRQAAEDYRALQSRVLGAHMQSKAQVPAGLSSPGATGHAEQPVKFADVDEAHEAALRALAASLAN